MAMTLKRLVCGVGGGRVGRGLLLLVNGRAMLLGFKENLTEVENIEEEEDEHSEGQVNRVEAIEPLAELRTTPTAWHTARFG